MSCITKQHVGKYTYLYESTSFRNAEGKPRNKKVRIGKIDPKTGNTIYTPEYLERMEAAGTPVAVEDNSDNDVDIADVLDSSKRYGSYCLFKELANSIKLLPTLQRALPDCFREVFTLACFLVESQEPLSYCSDWLAETEALPLLERSRLSSQRISELLSSITMAQRDMFYTFWMDQVPRNQYVALDITSISSYSELIESCEWGYNRDHEDLPQINLCMLFGEDVRLPLYQASYSGSISDVMTLKTTLKEVTILLPDRELRVVMDKGFYSQKNVDAMLDPESPVHFLISVPFSSSFAKKLVESERKDIDRIENTILTGGTAIRGIHQVRRWHTKSRNTDIHAHVYFNPIKAATERNELYAYVTELKQEALKDPLQGNLQKDFKKYLIIRKSSKAPSGWTVSINEKAIEEHLKYCGWMVLLSDTIDDSQEALDTYRTKDVVEKSFDRLKNTLDLNRLRVHKDIRMENKLFVSFIALLLISALHQRMKAGSLYKKYTMHELLLKVRKLQIAYVNGKKIIQPISKEQRMIFKDLGLKAPVG